MNPGIFTGVPRSFISLLILAACAESGDELKGYGYLACQEVANRQLVSPGSARYPHMSEIHLAVTDTSKDASTVRVIGYVDSQNQLGALLRTSIDCTVVRQADRTWRASQLTLDGRTVFADQIDRETTTNKAKPNAGSFW